MAKKSSKTLWSWATGTIWPNPCAITSLCSLVFQKHETSRCLCQHLHHFVPLRVREQKKTPHIPPHRPTCCTICMTMVCCIFPLKDASIFTSVLHSWCSQCREILLWEYKVHTIICTVYKYIQHLGLHLLILERPSNMSHSTLQEHWYLDNLDCSPPSPPFASSLCPACIPVRTGASPKGAIKSALLQ